MKSNKNKTNLNLIEALDTEQALVAVADTEQGVVPAIVKQGNTLRVYMQTLNLKTNADRDQLITLVKQMQKSRRAKKVVFDWSSFRQPGEAPHKAAA